MTAPAVVDVIEVSPASLDLGAVAVALTGTRTTLKAVRIYWHDEDGGLAPGTGISLLWAANAGVMEGQHGRLVEYAVAPLTISSGDFVVCLAVNNPAGILPMANDPSIAYPHKRFVLQDSIKGRSCPNFQHPRKLVPCRLQRGCRTAIPGQRVPPYFVVISL